MTTLITKYDSSKDTREHINRVRSLLNIAVEQLELRKTLHDLSKMLYPEKPIFDEMTPKLKGCTYGSEEYRGFLADMKPALDHHYANNSHHPEFFENGINGMSLLDLIEMVCDWKAATERHADGSIEKSLEINQKRFSISKQLHEVLKNTVRELGFLT